MRLVAAIGLLTAMVLGVVGQARAAPLAPGIGACGRADALVDDGKLADATDLATSVSAACEASVKALVDEAEAASGRLFKQAAATRDQAQKKRLATLALAIDNGNGNAQEILDGIESAQNPGPCKAADTALAEGEVARAKTLYKALSDDETAKKCRTQGLVAVAGAEESGLPTRIRRFVLEDALTTLLVALVAFAIGVVIAGYRRFRPPAALAWIATFATVGGLVVWQLARNPDNAASRGQVLSYVVLLVLAVGCGVLASSTARAARAVSIAMAGKTDAETVLAAQTVAELQALGGASPAGVFAVAGTDIAKSGVTAALDQVTNPVAKAVLAIWNAVQLGAGDRVQVVVETPQKSPISATVSVFEGRRLVQTQHVDGGDFCVDRTEPTEAELAQTGLDVASGIAAVVLLWKVKPTTVKAAKYGPEAARLYGASKPRSVALAAVAARRMARDPDAAALLYSRAVDLDSANSAARFGFLSAQLRGFPEDAEARRRVKELEQLLKDEPKESPLRWRILFNLGAAEANVAVTTEDRNMNAAIEHVKALPERFPKGNGLVVDSDKDLWECLKKLAEKTMLGLEPAGARVKPEPRNVAALRNTALTESRAIQAVLACGLALAYVRTDPNLSGERASLAKDTVERLRLAGETPTARKQLLEDPFTKLIWHTDALAALRAAWGPRTNAFTGIDSFGELPIRVAEVHPTVPALLAALSTVPGRSAAQSTFEVDDRVLDYWEGAARWLVARRPAARINLYQAAGYANAAAVRREPDAAVAAAIAGTAKLTGVSQVPTEKERAEIGVLRRMLPEAALRERGGRAGAARVGSGRPAHVFRWRRCTAFVSLSPCAAGTCSGRPKPVLPSRRWDATGAPESRMGRKANDPAIPPTRGSWRRFEARHAPPRKNLPRRGKRWRDLVGRGFTRREQSYRCHGLDKMDSLACFRVTSYGGAGACIGQELTASERESCVTLPSYGNEPRRSQSYWTIRVTVRRDQVYDPPGFQEWSDESASGYGGLPNRQQICPTAGRATPALG